VRFIEDGPNIPDLLLERRDQGRVVFLCGAGVSLSAGMPTFYKLTKYVVDFFDPPKNSVIESEFRPWIEDFDSGLDRPKTPLDQIFNLLCQEYGREEVNALVADRLRDPVINETQSIEHSVIARISSDQDGKPQIVTTNFDLLFESALREAEPKCYEPPAFPEISLGVPLTGITYLHGRLQNPDAEQHPYVLSSADFGRAYLSEGWATNFIRSLLKSYTVVLVGYQAEDPPVKYLLQGLNHDGLSDRSNLYAFDRGEPEDIEAKWRDRGVTAIACKDYPSLWQSLEAWASRADNPRQWRTNIINMAVKGPRKLSAHERGQIAHLVRTTPGARLFARTEPSPSPEWLCVFDARCRVAKKSEDYYGVDAETFDPFEAYGLDDDPPRPTETDKQSNWVHDHMLEWRRGDTNPPTFHCLGTRPIVGYESMPPRLFHLTNWITKHIDSPTTAWWAVRQRGMHPRLIKNIENALRGKNSLHPEARRAWNLILEYQSDSRNFSWDSGWYEIKDRINSEGWTPSVLRGFEIAMSPILSLERPLGVRASKPPLGDWEETGTNGVACWEAKFPNMHGEELDLPNEILESVFRILEVHLRRAAGLLVDLDTHYFTTPTCYPEREINGEGDDRHAVFRWFLKLFVRIVSDEPMTARGYVATWPTNEKFYFRKLKLFALNQVELFGANEVVEILLAFPQESFWDHDLRRELLFLINDRWEGFSEVNKEALADRLLNGPDKMEHWSVEEYSVIRDETAYRYTRWLTLQGKGLPQKQAARLEQLLSELPEWSDDRVSSLAEEHFGTVRGIGTNEAPNTIIDLPVSKVVERAQAEYRRDFDNYTNKRPFTGLVKINPRKALASLSHSARSGQYPKEFWFALINDWPVESTPRLFCVFLHRLGRLPHETVRELRHPIGEWLNTKLLSAFNFDESIAWQTFDHLVSGLTSDEGVATGSGIGEVRRGGEVIERSRRTFEHARNSPIGKAMEGLHKVLNSLKLGQGVEIPVEFKLRMEHLITAPGDGGDHAVTIITRQISWLYYLDPEWIKERVMQWFSFGHDLSEPAWNGYLSAAQFPPHEISIALKPFFLELFPRLYQWNWDQHLATVATQIAIELAIFHRDEPDGLSGDEARHCLRNMSEKNRQDAIFRLGVIGKREEDGWSKHVIPFINTVWPRERIFRTSNLVLSWVSLLESTGDKFPEVLIAVHCFLVPVERENHRLYQFGKEVAGKEPLTIKYPAEVLDLLNAIIPNSTEDIPYYLAQILDLIEETDSRLVGDRRFVRLMDLIELT
jgi:hypothetical protein